MSSNYNDFDLSLNLTRLSRTEITGIRVALGVSAVLAIVLGGLILASPQATLTVAAVMFGLYFLIIGIVRLVRGLLSKGTSGGIRVLNLLMGVLLLIAGVFAIKNPLNSIVALGILVGIAWIIEGVVALVETAPDSSRWFGTLFGAISVVAGIVVLTMPALTIAILTVVGGAFLVVAGIVQLVQAFLFGRKAKAA